MNRGVIVKKILINFAHPAKTKSKINRALREAVEGLEHVTVNDLYANYPDFMIDIKREQKLCEEHDVIIFQHPFYWYQAPSIVKEWMDLVLQHDWAYGTHGNALEGKLFMQALTAGGDESTYRQEGSNLHTIAELTSPFASTANLCKMQWIPPFVVLGIHRGLPQDQIKFHAGNYKRFITELRNGNVDVELAKTAKYCSASIDKIIRSA